MKYHDDKKSERIAEKIIATQNLFWTFSTDLLLVDVNVEFDWIFGRNWLIENDSRLRKKVGRFTGTLYEKRLVTTE